MSIFKEQKKLRKKAAIFMQRHFKFKDKVSLTCMHLFLFLRRY